MVAIGGSHGAWSVEAARAVMPSIIFSFDWLDHLLGSDGHGDQSDPLGRPLYMCREQCLPPAGLLRDYR